jgi:hypothetical protein
MEKNTLIATGRVVSISVNGIQSIHTFFDLNGPEGDLHSGFVRSLNNHDGDYRKTSDLLKGDVVFNWRSWTGLSLEEIAKIQNRLEYDIPPGCLLENLVISGVPNFSSLPPTTRLVFPPRETFKNQAILAIWSENDPCSTVGRRLEEHHKVPGLTSSFIEAARGLRGVMGWVISPGLIMVGDEVKVYSPA